jgi:hypothetical protein
LNFRNVSLTSTNTGEELSDSSKVLKTQIRKQMDNNNFNKAYVSNVDTTQKALSATFILALIINFILDGASTYLMGMIRAMQMVLHLPMLRVLFPANVSALYSSILPFVMFEILDPEHSTELVLDFDNDNNEQREFD